MKQILVELNGQQSVAQQMEAVRQEWESDRYQRLLLHVYSGLSDEAHTVQVARALQACLPGSLLVGTMSAGEILNGKLMEPGVLVSAQLFEQTQVQVLHYDHIAGRESEVGTAIRELLDADPAMRGAELLFPGTSINTRAFFAELSQCRPDLQIWGGYSGGHALNTPDHFIFDANGVMFDSMLVTTFSGECFHIDIDKIVGWEPLGLPFRVTKAEGNKLIELDGKPASEVYEKFLHIDRKEHNNAEESYAFPLLARIHGEELLRSAIHIEEDGALNLHGHVIEGMDIYLSYGNPARIVRKVNERLETIRRFRPEAILLYSCVVRKEFWGSLVNMEMEPFADLCSAGGFHTWGEVCRNMDSGEVVEHNVTLLTIALREGDASAADEDPVVRVNETVLVGQAALLRRLTSLIYTTMGELHQAHEDLRILNKKLTRMAQRDALTGLYNRGTIESLIDDALNTGAVTSLVMLDVDHFKQVNDVYGHHTGDLVLQDVAHFLGDAAQELGGEAGRWGGEEFFLMLPNMEEAAAVEAAEQLRRKVAEHPFPEVNHLTVSLGVITVQGEVNRRAVFNKVDDALYQAKKGGRNRWVLAKL